MKLEGARVAVYTRQNERFAARPQVGYECASIEFRSEAHISHHAAGGAVLRQRDEAGSNAGAQGAAFIGSQRVAQCEYAFPEFALFAARHDPGERSLSLQDP